MSVAAADVRIAIDGAPWRRCRRAVIASTEERSAAKLATLPGDSVPGGPGAAVDVWVRGAHAWRGAIDRISDHGNRGQTAVAESAASAAMRAVVGPQAWLNTTARSVLADVSPVPLAASAWPEAALPRFSLPAGATFRWAVEALRRACGLRSIGWTDDRAGSLRIGVLPGVAAPAPLPSITGREVLTKAGAVRVLPAIGLRRLDRIDVDGAAGIVISVRTVLAERSHVSTIVWEEQP